MSYRHALTLALLAALTIWAYSPVRSAGLVYEDRPIQTGIHDLRPEAWPRMMGRVSDVLGAQVCGPTPQCAHQVSVALHLINGLLLCLLLRRWMSPDRAVFLTAIFWLHPINAEAVSYLVGRPDLLLVCFALIGLLACRPRIFERPDPHWGAVAIMGLASLGAVMSKEVGIVVPVLLIAVYAAQRNWTLGVWAWRVVTPILVLVALGDAAIIWHTMRHWPPQGVQHPLPGLMSMQAAALWRYVALWLVPIGCSADHDWALVPHWLAVVALVGCLLTAGVAWRCRRRAPLVVLGVAWIALTLGPRFVIPAEGEYLNEHQLYLPFIGLLILVGTGWPMLRDHWRARFADFDRYMELCGQCPSLPPKEA